MKIKKGDFVTVDYTGIANGNPFDTTDISLAKASGLFKERMAYGPVTVVIGENHLLKGLDENLVGKEENSEYEFDINPEDGFGKKNPKLLQIIPQRLFKEHNLNLRPGMQVNMDGVIGTVKSVSSGRVVVDFNHPLSGKILNYKVKVHKIVAENKEKASALFTVYSGIPSANFTVKIDEKTVTFEYSEKTKIAANVKEKIKEDIKKYISLNEVQFVAKGHEKESQK